MVWQEDMKTMNIVYSVTGQTQPELATNIFETILTHHQIHGQLWQLTVSPATVGLGGLCAQVSAQNTPLP